MAVEALDGQVMDGCVLEVCLEGMEGSQRNGDYEMNGTGNARGQRLDTNFNDGNQRNSHLNDRVQRQRQNTNLHDAILGRMDMDLSGGNERHDSNFDNGDPRLFNNLNNENQRQFSNSIHGNPRSGNARLNDGSRTLYSEMQNSTSTTIYSNTQSPTPTSKMYSDIASDAVRNRVARSLSARTRPNMLSMALKAAVLSVQQRI